MAVLKLISDFYSAADKGKVSLLGLLDLLAVFDTVNHSILINHLHYAFGIQGTVLSWIKSFIEDRMQSVKFARGQSDKSQVLCGVPQLTLWTPGICFPNSCRRQINFSHVTARRRINFRQTSSWRQIIFRVRKTSRPLASFHTSN